MNERVPPEAREAVKDAIARAIYVEGAKDLYITPAEARSRFAGAKREEAAGRRTSAGYQNAKRNAEDCVDAAIEAVLRLVREGRLAPEPGEKPTDVG